MCSLKNSLPFPSLEKDDWLIHSNYETSSQYISLHFALTPGTGSPPWNKEWGHKKINNFPKKILRDKHVIVYVIVIYFIYYGSVSLYNRYIHI